jgi:hypothetical protein
MQNHVVLVAALCAATPFVQAQNDPAKHEMPNPKHAEHEALKQYVGTWQCKMQMPAMPGVKGMEKPTECDLTETGELLCNGLWLKWSSDGVMGGEPCQGLWLVGYDPFGKKYTSFCLSSHESRPSELAGSHDAKTKAWSWSGECETGSITSTVTWKDADTMVEVVRMTPPGATEPQTMTITRQRSKTAAASASRSGGADPVAQADLAAEQKDLLRLVGDWDAVVKMAIDPAQPPSEEKGTDRVRSICGGRYVWSDFHGKMMGQPFEGHCVVGYDTNAKEYVSYWFDSMSPTWAKTTGNGDAKSLTLQGRFLCPMGTPMTMNEVMTWKDADTRQAQMEFSGEQGSQKMEITYRRKAGKADKAGK